MASVYGGQKNLLYVSNVPMDSASVGKALRAEFLVIRDFLNASGILDCFGDDGTDICHQLASSFLYTWVIYECTCNTVRNLGHHSRRFYFLNESFVDISETALEYYYSTDPNIFDRHHAARLGMAVYMEHLDVVKKLAQARLDETEHAILVVLLS
ncbi:hypothetical protein AAVH_19014 [Aphelenchoides avenae]|nr:hypothetical protein AAVH_19014 [Aphelenchus avenae]